MREIPLTQGYVALVDDEDYDLVRSFKWCAEKMTGPKCTYRARRRTRKSERYVRRHITMHSFLLDADWVAHLNGDLLDNRRANLRVATRGLIYAGQRRPKNNTSGYKGVSWRKDNRLWSAHIRIDELIHLGMFESAEEAAHAYDAAALTTWGEFASLNFPNQKELQL